MKYKTKVIIPKITNIGINFLFDFNFLRLRIPINHKSNPIIKENDAIMLRPITIIIDLGEFSILFRKYIVAITENIPKCHIIEANPHNIVSY